MKVLKHVTSEVEALELRAVEIADAARGAIEKAYQLKPKSKAVLFDVMVQEYLKWSKENKKSWVTDEHRSKAMVKTFRGKLLSDINAFMVERFKMVRDKDVTKQTVNKELILGSQVYE